MIQILFKFTWSQSKTTTNILPTSTRWRLYPEPPLLIRRCVGGDDVPAGNELSSFVMKWQKTGWEVANNIFFFWGEK